MAFTSAFCVTLMAARLPRSLPWSFLMFAVIVATLTRSASYWFEVISLVFSSLESRFVRSSIMAWVWVMLAAHAASITQTQAMIEDLTNRLSRLEKTSEITSNQYDADRVKVATITANIKKLQGKERGKRAAIKVTQKALVKAIVRAYVLGASDAQILALFNDNPTQIGARNVYEHEVIGNLNELKHTYQKERTSLDSTIRLVGVQRRDAGQQTYAMSRLLSLNIYNTNTTRSTLNKMTVTLKGQIIAYEIQQGVLAAEGHNLAAEETAITAASAVGGQKAANAVTEAIQQASQAVTLVNVGSTAQGLEAVKAAESQIGVPYVWGGET